jgi:hypothetical protein
VSGVAQRVAAQQFPAQRDGHTVVVLAGARLPSTDPIVKAHPSMFEPVKRKRPSKRN